MTVTLGQLRQYCSEEEVEVDRREAGNRRDSSRSADCIRSLRAFLLESDIEALTDDHPVPKRTLEYYRYPGFAGDA